MPTPINFNIQHPLQATWQPMTLSFKSPAQTSRDTLLKRPTWFIRITHQDNPHHFGIGESAPLFGLSPETAEEMPQQLNAFCQNLQTYGLQMAMNQVTLPSLRFGIETALLDLNAGGQRILFNSPFVTGQQAIRINGLIWMGDIKTMLNAIAQKIDVGFSCLKLKIGALDWQAEYQLIKTIRQQFTAQQIEIRLDANGAFSTDNAMDKLNQLSDLDIHSIEQPIAPHQTQIMAQLCEQSPIAIALDEELIGINSKNERIKLLQNIQPAFIILKPTLLGGFNATIDWINCANQLKIGWWVTSALESNIGLNALSQWVANLNTDLPQGLGTGQLFTNNITCPLEQTGEWLQYNPQKHWDI